jgi:transcriptional regulator with XRE-family HTH domain
VATPLGEYLVRRRRELGMDRKTLAALSGLSYPYVSQLETSQDKRPSEKALRLLAPALEVELDELLEVADGWTSGSLTTPPHRVRSLRPRAMSTGSRVDALFALTEPGREEGTASHRELVTELDRLLAGCSPTERLAVLHELQARALEQLQQT